MAPDGLKVSSRDSVVTASWSGRPVDNFVLEYADNPAFKKSKSSEVKTTKATLADLRAGTTYYARVRSISPDGTKSSHSSMVRFDTTYPNEAPKVDVKSFTSTSMSVKWDKTTDSGRYEVQVSTTTDFTNPVVKQTVKPKKRFAKLAAGTLYAARVRVIDDQGLPLSRWSETQHLTTATYEPMGVATFNVLKWRRGNWSARRHAVVETIRNANVDVVGLQEATPSHIPGGPPQFQDIANLLGEDWALTRNTRGATGETRTVYNKSKLLLVQEGYQLIAGSTRFRGVPRYIAWAVFEQRTTGKRFIFVNTHFATGRSGAVKAHRANAALQLVKTVAALNVDRLPVVIVGDFNAAGYRNNSNGVYRGITGAGYIDPLAKTGKLGQAEKLVDATLRSVNGMTRRAPRRANGQFIDHIFVSRMRVSQWQVVAKLDSADRWIGTIPSDHNMVRATVYLP